MVDEDALVVRSFPRHDCLVIVRYSSSVTHKGSCHLLPQEKAFSYLSIRFIVVTLAFPKYGELLASERYLPMANKVS